MKPTSGSAAGPRRRAGQARRQRARQGGPGGRAARRLRSARHPDPVWARLLKRRHPEAFMQACRSVAFYVVPLDATLSRELFRLKPDGS
jgi:hypothetical protein